MSPRFHRLNFSEEKEGRKEETHTMVFLYKKEKEGKRGNKYTDDHHMKMSGIFGFATLSLYTDMVG